jgi:hypothetical protein
MPNSKNKSQEWTCIRGHKVPAGEYYCLPCVQLLRKPVTKEYYRKRRREHPYYKSERSLKVNRERVARYEERNREKKQCRLTLYDAVRTGKLIRPSRCSRCGLICKPQAHHPDYSKPLEVIWACRECHVILDSAIRSSPQPGLPQKVVKWTCGNFDTACEGRGYCVNPNCSSYVPQNEFDNPAVHRYIKEKPAAPAESQAPDRISQLRTWAESQPGYPERPYWQGYHNALADLQHNFQPTRDGYTIPAESQATDFNAWLKENLPNSPRMRIDDLRKCWDASHLRLSVSEEEVREAVGSCGGHKWIAEKITELLQRKYAAESQAVGERHQHTDLMEAMQCPDCKSFTPWVPGPSEEVISQGLGHSAGELFSTSQNAGSVLPFKQTVLDPTSEDYAALAKDYNELRGLIIRMGDDEREIIRDNAANPDSATRPQREPGFSGTNSGPSQSSATAPSIRYYRGDGVEEFPESAPLTFEPFSKPEKP